MEEEVRNIRQYLISRCKEIGRLLTAIPITVDLNNKQDIASATAKNINLYYKFFELSNSHKCGVLLHEVLHVALGHPYRSLNFHPVVMNIAEDLIINHMIVHDFNDPTVTIPEEGLSFEVSPFNKALHTKPAEQWTAEALYYWLLENLPTTSEPDGIPVDRSYFPANSPRSQADQNIKKPNNGSYEADVVRSKEPATNEDLLRNQRLLQELAAGNQTNKLIRRIAANCKKPILPWRSLLRRYMLRALIDHRVYDYSRPTNIFLVGIDPYEPSSRQKKGIKSIAILRDTSGSVFYSKMLVEVMRLVEDVRRQIPTTLYLVDVDTEVKQIQVIKNTATFDPKDYKPLQGGGGTDFSQGIAKINELKPDIIIGITDGYTNSWGTTKIPTYWVVTTNVQPPYGKLIQYQNP